jgi:hypothetical protein
MSLLLQPSRVSYTNYHLTHQRLFTVGEFQHSVYGTGYAAMA